MNGSAIMVMVLAMTMIWGGLILSMIHLMKNPDVPMDSVPDDI